MPSAMAAGSSATAVFPDNATYDEILAAYVVPGDDGINRVDYGALRAQALDALRGYLSAMEAVDLSRLSQSDRIAYWINLYNSKTLEVVASNYPIRSIRQIDLGGGLLARGPWKAKIVSVGGNALSLDDIEHAILRARYADPRIHYALNCASIGCPNLQVRAWRAETLEKDFETGARAYVNHPRGLNPGPTEFTASKIYKWYAADFGKLAGLRDHWAAYAATKLAQRLDQAGRPDRYVYDWSLNDKS